VKGDGTPCRSYLYAADLMIFLWTIFFKGESCVPYNVGSDLEINIKSLAEIVSSAFEMEKDEDVVISRKPDLMTNIDRYVPSTKRAQEKLDLKQEIDLQDAIKRTIKHIKFRERNI
jgi:dTDP-glucose 4,6-dehydratase